MLPGLLSNAADLDLLPIRQCVFDYLTFKFAVIGLPFLFFLLRIERHIASLLFDRSDDLLLRTCLKDIATLSEQQLHVLRHVPPSDVYSADAAWHSEALVYGDSM